MTKQLSDIDEKKMKEVFSETPEDAIKRRVFWKNQPPQKFRAISSTKVKKCPVCDGFNVTKTDEPIKHWFCPKCSSVFVKDKDGLLALFPIEEYKQKREVLCENCQKELKNEM